MTITKHIASGIAATLVVAAVGLAYAQTTPTDRGAPMNPAASERGQTQPGMSGSTTTPPMRTDTTPSTTNNTTSTPMTSTDMPVERAAQADRN